MALELIALNRGYRRGRCSVGVVVLAAGEFLRAEKQTACIWQCGHSGHLPQDAVWRQFCPVHGYPAIAVFQCELGRIEDGVFHIADCAGTGD